MIGNISISIQRINEFENDFVLSILFFIRKFIYYNIPNFFIFIFIF